MNTFQFQSNAIAEFQGSYRFLSNFWTCAIADGGMVYASVEHAYQASKFPPGQRNAFIQPSMTAGMAKREGHGAILTPDWNDRKVSIMRRLLYHKFRDNTDLQAQLLQTGDRQLVEGNHWGDTFWGVCNGKGRNFLGMLLMEVRQTLRQEGSS